MTTLNTIIEEEKKEFEGAFMNNGINGVLGDEFQEPKMLLMRNHFTTAIQRAYEAGQSEERERVKEMVESVIDDYCIDGEWQLNQVLGRVEKALLAKLTENET